MNKNYKYLGKGANTNEVPEGWEDVVKLMLSKIDHLVRPFYVPIFVMNLIYGDKGTPIIYIEQIKEKFGGLRVYTEDNEKHKLYSQLNEVIKNAVKTCDNTCQDCSETLDVQHSIYGYNGRWIKNLCSSCRDEQKYVTTASAKKYRDEKVTKISNPIVKLVPVNIPKTKVTVPKTENISTEAKTKKKNNKNH